MEVGVCTSSAFEVREYFEGAEMKVVWSPA